MKYYKCRCGYTFGEEFGKYGCPFCNGNPPAILIKRRKTDDVKKNTF